MNFQMFKLVLEKAEKPEIIKKEADSVDMVLLTALGVGSATVFGAFIGFGLVNKAEIDAFLELSCFFDDPADAGYGGHMG